MSLWSFLCNAIPDFVFLPVGSLTRWTSLPLNRCIRLQTLRLGLPLYEWSEENERTAADANALLLHFMNHLSPSVTNLAIQFMIRFALNMDLRATLHQIDWDQINLALYEKQAVQLVSCQLVGNELDLVPTWNRRNIAVSLGRLELFPIRRCK